MSKILIRPARTKDKPAVEAISGQMWDNDYIPDVWDGWLADPHGRFFVAELEDRVAGFAKLSRLADDEWWMEGLRVDPAHWGQGIARQLQARQVEMARRIGRGTLRFGTHSENEPIHRIAARDGFRRVATYRPCRADPLLAGDTPLRCLTGSDLPAAWTLIDESPRHRTAGELYEVSWKWKRLTRERLARHLAAGEVWGTDAEGELAGLAITFQRENRDALCAGYVDGLDEVLGTILRELRGLAAQLGRAEMRFKPVNESALVMAVEAAGYEHSWDRYIWIFELELEGA